MNLDAETVTTNSERTVNISYNSNIKEDNQTVSHDSCEQSRIKVNFDKEDKSTTIQENSVSIKVSES